MTNYTEKLTGLIFSSASPIVSESERIREIHEEASNTIRRVFFAILGTSLFCVVTLAGSADTLILNPVKSVELPILKYDIGFEAFLLIGPIILISLITYLHVFVGFQRKHAIHDDLKTPILPNMQDMSARTITWILFYWTIPIVLAYFTWKAWPDPTQGPILFLVSVITFLALILVQIHRCPVGWRLIGTSALIVIFLVSVMGFSQLLNARILNLANSDLASSDLKGLVLNRAVMEGADLSNADLSEAQLNQAKMRGAILTKADLNGASLKEAILSDADLTQTVFSGAELSNAQLNHTTLSGAKLDSANLRCAYLVEANLHKADLRRATMSGADFSKARLNQADFRNTDIIKVNLSEADLSGALFENALIAQSQLSGANLSGVSLSGVEFYDVDLSGANLSAVLGLTVEQLEKSCADRKVNLPKYLGLPAKFKLEKCEVSYEEDCPEESTAE